MCLRTSLDGRKISSPLGFDPGLSSPQSVTISTELPGPYVSTCSTLTQHQSMTLKAGYAQLSTYKTHKNQKSTLLLPKIGSNGIATLDVQPNSAQSSCELNLHLLMCRKGIFVKAKSFDICCSNINKYYISSCD